MSNVIDFYELKAKRNPEIKIVGDYVEVDAGYYLNEHSHSYAEYLKSIANKRLMRKHHDNKRSTTRSHLS